MGRSAPIEPSPTPPAAVTRRQTRPVVAHFVNQPDLFMATVLDAFSRAPLALQVFAARPRAKDMARLFRTATRLFATPKYMITDRGGEFTATVFRKARSASRRRPALCFPGQPLRHHRAPGTLLEDAEGDRWTVPFSFPTPRGTPRSDAARSLPRGRARMSQSRRATAGSPGRDTSRDTIPNRLPRCSRSAVPDSEPRRVVDRDHKRPTLRVRTTGTGLLARTGRSRCRRWYLFIGL
jgi:hypothetical protein